MLRTASNANQFTIAGSLAEDVGPGRVAENRELLAAQRWCRALVAASLLDPVRPVLPPGHRVHGRRGEPFLGILGQLGGGAHVVPRLRIRWVDDPGDMTGVRQHETHVAAGQPGADVGTTPPVSYTHLRAH